MFKIPYFVKRAGFCTFSSRLMRTDALKQAKILKLQIYYLTMITLSSIKILVVLIELTQVHAAFSIPTHYGFMLTFLPLFYTVFPVYYASQFLILSQRLRPVKNNYMCC